MSKTRYINKSTIVNKHYKHTVFTNMLSDQDGMLLIGVINNIKIEREP